MYDNLSYITPLADLSYPEINMFSDRRIVISAVLLTVAAIPWLLALDWRPMLIGVFALVTAIALFLKPDFARLALPVLCGVSVVIFFIAGLNREGIDIGGRAYMGMQLLTPFSIIAMILFRRSQKADVSGDSTVG